MPELSPWIETFTGKRFEFLDPKHDQIDIRDIAHSLAYTCRYTGHSKKFYSVAEHSILVSYLAIDPLAGLLHDSSEAYITDIASPIKPHLANYKELEDNIMNKIAAKFGFTYPLDHDIKDCDATQLKTEAKHLLHSKGQPWAYLYPTKRPHGITPNCWGPEEAEKKFLERFEEVRNDWNVTTKLANQVVSRRSDVVSSNGLLICKRNGLQGQGVQAEPRGGPCSRYDQDYYDQGVGLADVTETLIRTAEAARARG
jgi:hypothetical protein